MGEENKDQTSQNPQDVIQPAAVTEYVDETNNHPPNTSAQTNYTQKKENEPVNVIVNLPQENGDPQRKANIISIAGFVVNLILAVFTYLLFLQTGKANRTAAEALQEARRANEISARSLDAARINDSINRMIADKSVAAQIMALNFSNRQFDATNQPFLHFSEITLSPVRELNYIATKFKLTNVGTTPIQLISQNTAVTIDTSDQNVETRKKLFTIPEPLNVYVGSGDIYWSRTLSPKGITQAQIKLIHDPIGYAYILREITYENLVTHKRRIYRLYIKVKPMPANEWFPNNTYYEVLVNENLDIK